MHEATDGRTDGYTGERKMRVPCAAQLVAKSDDEPKNQQKPTPIFFSLSSLLFLPALGSARRKARARQRQRHIGRRAAPPRPRNGSPERRPALAHGALEQLGSEVRNAREERAGRRAPHVRLFCELVRVRVRRSGRGDRGDRGGRAGGGG